jgi:ATP-dependent RNA helicase DHX37/DHR1
MALSHKLFREAVPFKKRSKFYFQVTGVTSFVVAWTSQAAANQRAGRAGRQGPGHAYRLYSSAIFNNDMKPFAAPEIQQKPADGLLLQMKVI